MSAEETTLPASPAPEQDQNMEPPAPTWSEIQIILRNMETMGKTLITVQEKLEKMQTSKSKTTGKFNEPTMFNGKAVAVPAFVQSIQDTLWLQRDIYITDKDKAIYLSTYLGPGTPREWYNAILKLNPHCLHKFDEFLAAFIKNFGDSNLTATAQHKLDALFQTGPVSQYAAKFMEHIVYLDVTESSKIYFFTRHLKPRVKDAIALVTDESTIPKVLKLYIDWVMKIDNRLHEREIDMRHDAKLTGNGSSFASRNNGFLSNSFAGSTFRVPGPTPTPTSTLPPGEPMEIDATRTSKPRGPLTAEERQRRKEKNLCMYCGGANHKANNCPNMSDKAKKAYQAKASTAKVAGKATTAGKA